MPPTEITEQEDSHSLSAGTTVSILAIVIIAIAAFIYYSDTKKDTTPTSDYGDFTPKYIDSAENIEAPGTFPIDLIDGEGLTLDSGSYLVDEGRGTEQYLYSVLSSQNASDMIARARQVLEADGFLILGSDELSFTIYAERQSDESISRESVSYMAIDTGDGSGAYITYERTNVFSVADNKQDI